MGQVIISEHLAPPNVGVAHTYLVETRTELRLPGQQLSQASATLLRLTVREADAATGYLLELDTLAVRPASPVPPLTALLTDLARHQSPLLMQTDAHGALQRITNKTDLAARWQAERPALLTQYHAQPGAAALLELVAAQYDEQTDQLEQALAHRGPAALLLPGYYGLHSWRGDTRTDAKTVAQALGQVDVPLRVRWTATPTADVFAPTVEVEGVGQLDRACFDEQAAQRFLTDLRGGVWTGPPAPLQVFWREQYTVGRLGQGLLAGRLGLRLAVDKLYFADFNYTVRPATALPPA